MKKITVMLADDNEEFCEIVETYLKQQPDISFIESIHNGAEAYERIKEMKPDIAILDGAMPGLDGLGILEKLNKEGSRPVCIMLSGIRNDNVINRAYDLGAEYYIIKPFDLDTLAERIRMFRDIIAADSKSKNNSILADPVIQIPNLEERVTDILNEIGMPANFHGYRYLRHGIIMAVKDIQSLNRITKGIYPAIAQVYNTTPSRVERAIRHAIDIVWKRGSSGAIDKIFANPANRPKGKPTNGEFIAFIADKIRLEGSRPSV